MSLGLHKWSINIGNYIYHGVSPYFPTGFEGVLPSIPNFTLVFPTEFSKDSPHIFPERFLGELYISIYFGFSHRVFQSFQVYD